MKTKLLKLSLIASFVFTGLLIFSLTTPTKVQAANQSGWGWALPVGRTTTADACFPATNRVAVTILLVDSQTKAAVNANIRIADPGGAIAAQGFGSQLSMVCADINRGVWVSVWGAGGYRAWDLPTNFQGNTQQFNWCCGFQFLDKGADVTHTVTYQINLVPNGISIPTITAVSSTGTDFVTAGQHTIYTANAGGTYNVPFNITSGPVCPCGPGNRIINRYLWVRNTDTGAVVFNADVDGFGGSFGFGTNINYTVNNLPVGHYQWYMQYQENRRNYAFIPDTLPITSQMPWQYFEIVAAAPPPPPPPVGPPPPPVGPPPPPPPGGGLPDLVVDSLTVNPNPSVVGQTVTFTAVVRNAGNASTGVGFTNRFCISNNNCYTSALNIINQQASGTLLAGATTTVTFPRTFPAAVANTIYFCTDVVPVPPPGAVTESNDTAASNCRNTPITVSALPLLPNLNVNSVTPLGPLIVGINVDFRAVVQNSGNAGSAANQGRFCVDNPNCYTNNAGQIGAQPPIGVLAPAVGVAVNTTSPWLAAAGTHTIYFCADVPGPSGVVPESNENDNCNNTGPLTVSSNNSWLQTQGGDVGSLSNITFNSPPAGQADVSYLAIANAAAPTGLVWPGPAARNWLLRSYNSDPPSPSNYAEFNTRFSGLATLTGNKMPGVSGSYLFSGNMAWNGGFNASCPSGSNTGVVVFVNGNLAISGGTAVLNSSCSTAIFVSGSISIAANITQINATLIADGVVTTQSAGVAADTKLAVIGGVYSSLTIPGVGTAPKFTRWNTDPNQPSEQFVYDPKILWVLATSSPLGVSRNGFQEVNP